LARGFFGRCPACGRGRVFKGFYDLNATCASCAARFHHDGSPTVGAMIITMFITILLGFGGAIPLVISTTPDTLMLGLALWLVALTVFSAIFYRFARGLWVGITTLTGANEEG
jgi:uncharacterized protein (DUF983 family)